MTRLSSSQPTLVTWYPIIQLRPDGEAEFADAVTCSPFDPDPLASLAMWTGVHQCTRRSA